MVNEYYKRNYLDISGISVPCRNAEGSEKCRGKKTVRFSVQAEKGNSVS